MGKVVMVKNSDDTYLHPTTNNAHVRHLLKEGKAEIVSKNPFTIKLKKYVKNAGVYVPF